MIKRVAAVLFFWLAAFLGPAIAQQSPSPVQQAWFMQAKLTSPISVTTSTAATALPTPGFMLWACNTGANDIYVALGNSGSVSVTVATGSWIKASTCNAYNLWPFPATGPYTYIAAIGSGGSSTLYLEAGTGTPPGTLGGAGGGGGSSGAVFGPTATGLAAANPPVLIGGTTTGGATGTVQGAAVKPASTAAATTDPALVVQNAYEQTQLAALVAGLLTPPIQVINGGGTYNTIAASQTAQVLTGGSGGAVGDYLSHCVIYPTSASPGVFTVFDNSSSAANNVIAFPGGASSLSNLVPISIPVAAFSVNGPWKVTSGANMVATCYGKFH